LGWVCALNAIVLSVVVIVFPALLCPDYVSAQYLI
jgi:hypothetical protein